MQKKNVNVTFQEGPLQMEYFGEFAQWWYYDHKNKIAETTYDGYRYTLDKLNDTFGKWRLLDITPYHVETYLDAALLSGLSKSYVAKLRAMLFQIMQKAEGCGIISKNPVPLAEATRTPMDKLDNPFIAKDAFTTDEIKALYAKLPMDKFGASIRIMLSSGVRLQEMLALQHNHSVQDGTVLQVRQAVKVVRGIAYVGVPKSLASFRDVPLPEISHQAMDFLLNQDSNFLVPGKADDQPYNPKSYRKTYYKYLEDCGVRLLSPHCCRHTYVSQLQAAGVDIETIKHLVGHSKIKMTSHYLHVQSGVKLEAVAKLNTLYAS